MEPQLTPYSHIAGPRVDKVGVAQFEFQARSAEDFRKRGTECEFDRRRGQSRDTDMERKAQDRYFEQVEKLQGMHDRVAKVTGDNPSNRILTMLAELLPEWDFTIAHEQNGRRYHSGIYRTINNSTPIHCDWSPYDSATEDWIINKISCQVVFNLYLTPVASQQLQLIPLSLTAEEETMARHLNQILGANNISAESNFFAMSGDSIAAIRLSGSLRKEGLQLRVGGIHRHPTLSGMVKCKKARRRAIPQPERQSQRRSLIQTTSRSTLPSF